jgi:hypothetical protein
MESKEIQLSVTLDPLLVGGEDLLDFDTLGLYGLWSLLVEGGPLPLTLGIRSLTPEALTGASIFLQRDLLLEEGTLALVLQVNSLSQATLAYRSHVPKDLLYLMDNTVLTLQGLQQRDLGDGLVTATQWVRDYIREGRLPQLSAKVQQPPEVLDTGTNGFVFAKGQRQGVEGLFRIGFLRGLLLDIDSAHVKSVVLFRKTSQVGFDLELGLAALNEMERLTSGDPDLKWVLDGDQLISPVGGTVLLVSDILQLALRI